MPQSSFSVGGQCRYNCSVEPADDFTLGPARSSVATSEIISLLDLGSAVLPARDVGHGILLSLDALR
jgi:hypothetical protein